MATVSEEEITPEIEQTDRKIETAAPALPPACKARVHWVWHLLSPSRSSGRVSLPRGDLSWGRFTPAPDATGSLPWCGGKLSSSPVQVSSLWELTCATGWIGLAIVLVLVLCLIGPEPVREKLNGVFPEVSTSSRPAASVMRCCAVRSTREEVKTSEGEPTRIQGDVWHYGKSWVRFEGDFVMSWHSSPERPLQFFPVRQ